MPQAPALRQSQPSMARKNGGVYLIGSTADMKENFYQLQAQNKKTKKQLKMAQAQLDKLSQINIHLHGMLFRFILFHLLLLFLIGNYQQSLCCYSWRFNYR